MFLINRLDSIVNVLFLCGEINACAIKCVLFGKNVNFSSAEWAMSEALLKAAQERYNPLRKQASCWSWVSAAHSGAFVHEKLTSSSFCPGGPGVIGFAIK